jgi:hypothetical protein
MAAVKLWPAAAMASNDGFRCGIIQRSAAWPCGQQQHWLHWLWSSCLPHQRRMMA